MTQIVTFSTNVFNFPISTFSGSKISVQCSPKQLEKHLETDPRDRWIISSLRQLIPNEGVLSPSYLVETERYPGIVQSLSDEIAAFRWDMIIPLPEDHNQLAFYIFRTLEAVVGFTFAQAVGVDVGRKVAHRGPNPIIQGASVGEMATETHAFANWISFGMRHYSSFTTNLLLQSDHCKFPVPQGSLC